MLKEKIIRKLNATVQKSPGFSPAMKLFSQNAELVLEITKRLSALTSDSDTDIFVRKQTNEKLLRILEILDS